MVVVVYTRNYRLLDLSRSFAEINDETEMFVDSYHFADLVTVSLLRLLPTRSIGDQSWQGLPSRPTRNL